MLKIVVISERLWPEGSGGELATSLILRELMKLGDFNISVYTGTRYPSWIPKSSVFYVPILRTSNKVGLFINLLTHMNFFKKIISKADIVYIPRLSYPIVSLANKIGKKVVIHLHGYQPVSYTAVVFSGEESTDDIRRTLTLERMDKGLATAVTAALISPVILKMMRLWIAAADKVICVSRRHEEIISKHAPELRDKTEVIYNPVPDIHKVDRNVSEIPTLLYKGGDSIIKGFHVLLSALKTLCRVSGFRLIFTNNYSERAMKLLRSLRCRYTVEIYGRLDYPSLMKLQSSAWGVLAPSIWEEPLPMAVLESAALGVIPIASKIGGIPEIVEGTPAEPFLVRPGCSDCLAEKIEQLISSTSIEDLTGFRLRLADTVRNKFDQKVIIKKFVGVLDKLNY